MDKITLSFDELPEAVNRLDKRLDRIEQLLQTRNNDDPEPEAPLLTSSEAMKLLHIKSPGTLINYKKNGLPFCQLGRQCLYNTKDLTNYLKSKTKKI